MKLSQFTTLGAGAGRAALLDIAVDMMLEEGHAAVDLPAVSRAAGLRWPLTRRWFRSTDELLTAVLRRFTETELRRHRRAMAAPDTVAALWAFHRDAPAALLTQFDLLARRNSRFRHELHRHTAGLRAADIAALRRSGAETEWSAEFLALAIAAVSRSTRTEESLGVASEHAGVAEFATWLTRISPVAAIEAR